MPDVLDGVRDHYRATGLTERLKTALAALGPQNRRLTPPQLAAPGEWLTVAHPASPTWLCRYVKIPVDRRATTRNNPASEKGGSAWT